MMRHKRQKQYITTAFTLLLMYGQPSWILRSGLVRFFQLSGLEVRLQGRLEDLSSIYFGLEVYIDSSVLTLETAVDRIVSPKGQLIIKLAK